MSHGYDRNIKYFKMDFESQKKYFSLIKVGVSDV